jgi:PAS domain S-box-containing protein/putative nucleotidyltransferase with HDIG domain
MNEIISLKKKSHILEQINLKYAQMNEELSEIGNCFDQLLENSPIYIFLKDDQGRSIRLSRNFEDMLGSPINELLGKPMDDIFPPGCGRNMSIDDLHGLNDSKQITTEEQFNGRFYTTTQFPIHLEKPGYIAGYTIDITDQKKLSDDLTNSEEKFRKIFYISPDPTCIQRFEDSIIIMINEAFTKTFGYTEEDIIGRNDIDYNFWNSIDQRGKIVEILKNNGNLIDFQSELKTRQGEILNVMISAAMIDLNGIPHVISITRDITRHLKIHKNLEDSLSRLRRSLETTIQVLSSAVEARDPYTAGHQRRVTNLARMIATEMCLPSELVEGIRLAGLIHDVGKIRVPAEILSKPSNLSEHEYALVQEHAQLGYEILKDVESPFPLADIVRQHHERINGSGYPQGLDGKNILIEARILSVADVVEAMASHRPYRPALGIDTALEEIKAGRGTEFDPNAVDACLKIFKEDNPYLHNDRKAWHV